MQSKCLLLWFIAIISCLGHTVSPTIDFGDYTHNETVLTCLTAPESDNNDDLDHKYDSLVAGKWKPEGGLTVQGLKLLNSPLVVGSVEPHRRARQIECVAFHTSQPRPHATTETSDEYELIGAIELVERTPACLLLTYAGRGPWQEGCGDYFEGTFTPTGEYPSVNTLRSPDGLSVFGHDISYVQCLRASLFKT